MTFYLGRVGIKLHFLFFIVLAYMLSFEIGKYYITSLFYACIHEFAHIAVLSKLYDGDFTVTLGAFGMRLQYDDCVRFSLKNEAVTEFSGPAVNAVMGTAFFILYKIQPDSEFFCISFIINASLGLFNLLPVIPLDGGRFLCMRCCDVDFICVIYCFCPVYPRRYRCFFVCFRFFYLMVVEKITDILYNTFCIIHKDVYK